MGTKGRRGIYTVDVLRPGCTHERPLYDTTSGACVDACSSGFYPNQEARRCSKCNTNCAVCRNIFQCELCKKDTADSGFIIQVDGSCLEVRKYDRWKWWAIGAAIFINLLLFICFF